MNIFVANLNFKVDDGGLQSLFEEYGAVTSSKVIIDRETGKSKGFGFVEMPDYNNAMEAIEKLDGLDHLGKRIVVKKARPKKPSGQGNYQNNSYNNNSYYR